MNGARLGIHETLKDLIGAHPGASLGFLRNLAAGAMAGTIGAMVASPFYFVKVKLNLQFQSFFDCQDTST